MKSEAFGRRVFLARAALLTAGVSLTPSFLLRPARAATSSRRVLVVLFQRGAVDGLSMVVPHGEPGYYAVRSSIAIPRPGGTNGALDLDGRFGLHPAMAALLPAWEAGELAAVHACGSPDPTRSHFDAQDFMEGGVPGDRSVTDGWLNRYLQGTASSSGALRAVALTAAVPRILSGSAATYAATSLTDLTLGGRGQAEIALAAIERMYGPRSDLLGATVRETLATYDVVEELGRRSYTPANGATYPAGDLGRQLREVAQVLKAEIGVEIAFVDTAGWDTHANQGGASGALAGLLRELADALAAFRQDLGDGLAEVCVLTLSEFGRTVAENGTRGTDHGRGTAMLLLGGTVRGGSVYGRWPGLGPAALYEGRDLEVTTDFRALCSEVLTRHLGAGILDTVFPGFGTGSASLGVMRS